MVFHYLFWGVEVYLQLFCAWTFAQNPQDGVIVAFHDELLDRTTNASGYISDYTYEYLYNNVGGGGGGVMAEAVHPITLLRDLAISRGLHPDSYYRKHRYFMTNSVDFYDAYC